MKLAPKAVLDAMLTDEARYQRWLDVEAALALSQGELEVIPEEAALLIKEKANVEYLDMSQYASLYEQTGHPMVSLLKLFQSAVGKNGEYIHLGATTQDIMDTGMMLLLKEVWGLTRSCLLEIEDELLCMSERYADTIMAGRTHNIQALPITFGFKVAVWAREIRRNIERLSESEKRNFVIQLSGAVGTLAAFANKGFEIQSLVAKKLSLEVPDITWHASRDRICEIVNTLALVSGTMARIAQEVYLLMATEIGELTEGWTEGKVGSSTMPHKINPVHCQHVMASARSIRYIAAQIMEDMVVDHERNMVHFIDERVKLEELCGLMGEVLTRSVDMLENLFVDEVRMRKNLDILKGAMQSEAVMLVLGKSMGKQTAHEVVNAAATKAVREGLDLAQLLMDDSRVRQYISREELDELLNPEGYTGQAGKIVRQVVALSRKERE